MREIGSQVGESDSVLDKSKNTQLNHHIIVLEVGSCEQREINAATTAIAAVS